MMIARYERDKLLNVREEPRDGSRVVRTMAPGEEAACHGIRNGWADLGDGYAKAALLVIEDGGPEERKPEDAEDAADDHGRDDGELGKMTVKQLREVAEGSGIHVRKDATKREIIDAILGDA